MGTWTIGNGGGYWNYAQLIHGGKRSNYIFYDGHVKAVGPCQSFGDLSKWKVGDTPPDDFLWGWYTGPDPAILQGWKNECSQKPDIR